jgi:hypothetical protein
MPRVGDSREEIVKCSSVDKYVTGARTRCLVPGAECWVRRTKN